MKKIAKVLIIIGVIVSFYLFYKFGLAHHLRLENIKVYIKDLHAWTHTNYGIAAVLFMVTYALVVLACLPATAPVVMIGGFLFGTFWATLYSAIAGTLGAMVAFLLFRSVWRETVEKKYGTHVIKFRSGLKEYGSFYLLLLHFMFVIPFFIINMLAALAGVSLWRFIWSTFIGILPCVFIYAFSGEKLFSIQSVQDIFSWQIVAALILLVIVTLLPILYKSCKKRGYFWGLKGGD